MVRTAAIENPSTPSPETPRSAPASAPQRRLRLGWILALYLLGIFMGAIDTGIVSPARTLIQNSLGVDGPTGIWMITIYTLAYAAIIPISGKLADRFGRKTVYLVSIALFGLGSLLAALSHGAGSFGVLLAGRVVQALGGGGIIPVATAEFGTTFPENRRGLALGLVGGVYGIANIRGSSAGSAILDAFGKERWELLFLVNVPISAAILALGVFLLPNSRGERTKPIDWAGIPVLALMVLALLYGLRNIDFFDFGASVASADVYPFLIGFAVLLPVFLLIERRAADPVLDLGLFRRRETLVTLVLSFLVGVMMMGMVFVPQMSENSLHIASGSGGYFVAVLGLFAGLSGPLSGTLIDRIGAKRVLAIGFAVTLGGSLFLILRVLPHPNYPSVLGALALIGLGLGFTIGTPLNYMMLAGAPKEESNSALAALSLIRSIGTAVAPAIMVGFLAQAGISAQVALMDRIPPVGTPTFAHLATLQAEYDALKANPDFAAQLDGKVPDLSKYLQAPDPSAMQGGELPADLQARLQGADVTTIVDLTKEVAARMYDQYVPGVVERIRDGLATGLAGLDGALAKMQEQADGLAQALTGAESGLAQMDDALAGLDAALANPFLADAQRTALDAQRADLAASRAALAGKADGLRTASAGLAAGLAQLGEFRATMQALSDEVPAAFAAYRTQYLASIEAERASIEATFQNSLDGGFRNMFLLVSASTVLAFLVLLFYREKRKTRPAAASAVAPEASAS